MASNDAQVDPRVYIGCLHCYVGGELHGRWFDVGTDPDDLHHEVMGFFAAGCATCGEYEPECAECRASAERFPCGGEELAIHDHEGLGDVGEAYDLEQVCAIAQLRQDYPDRPVLEYLATVTDDVDQARAAMQDYAGRWQSLAEWAESWAEDAGLGLKELWPYIDFERYARDMELSCDVETLETADGVHVFRR